MSENRLEDLDEIFADEPKTKEASGNSLERVDPLFSSPPAPKPPAPKQKEFEVDKRDLAAAGAALGFGSAVRQQKIENRQRQARDAVEKAEMRRLIEELARKPEEIRPGAQPAGSTALQIMEPGRATSGDKWARAIGGPGGETTLQAQENYRMLKNLSPGETLMRTGLALPPGVDVPRLAQESMEREIAATRPSIGQRAIPPLMAFSRMIAPNRFISALTGAMAGHKFGEAAEQMEAGNQIDAILSGMSGLGSAAMAWGNPAIQIPGAIWAGFPYVGREIAPLTANMIESLFPLRTGLERPMTREEAIWKTLGLVHGVRGS